MVDAKPDGYHTVSPYLVVDDVAALIQFTEAAFGAEPKELIRGPDGQIRHAEVTIGDSVVMMGQSRGEWKAMPGCLYVYVDDVDATFRKAIEAGAKPVSEPTDQFYGDRSAGAFDPQGNYWGIATHIEDVDPEELQRRSREARH